MKYISCAASLAAVLALATDSFAGLYENNFDTDTTASWTVNDPALTDILVDFNYDYSAIGVPAAPGGATTLGLKMTANNADGVFGGFSVSPTGQSFSGDYQVSFDLWQNYVGPLGAGGSGTTQLSTFGIGTAGSTAVWPGGGTSESLMFGATLDGGSSVDYRAYSSAATTGYPDADPVFLAGAHAGNRNGSDPYYSGFGGDSAPGDQVTLYPGQTGSTDAGEISFQWRKVLIDVSGGFATWSVDGLPIAKVDLSTVTLGGGNFLLGHSDTNNSSSADANDTLLNVTLIDNVRVVVPEPSTLLLTIVLAMGALVGRRRHS